MRRMARGTILRQISKYGTKTTRPPIISIDNGTFYRHHPNSTPGDASTNPPLFKDLNFQLESFAEEGKYWAVIGPSSAGKTTLLRIFRGKYLCNPPNARIFPFLEHEQHGHGLRTPEQTIKQVGFDGEQGLGAQAPQSAYMSARYESRREDTDYSVIDYLKGNTELNPLQNIERHVIQDKVLERVVRDLRLGDLVDMPVSNLSNGQTRRARIAKALLADPEVLLLDEPFMGLDPPTLLTLSPMLYGLAKANAPRLVLSLRPQDPLPDWITHLIVLSGKGEIAFQGERRKVLRPTDDSIREPRAMLNEKTDEYVYYEIGLTLTKDCIVDDQGVRSNISSSDNLQVLSRDGYPINDLDQPQPGEALVQMNGARVQYKGKAVLGNWKQSVPGKDEQRDGLWWTVRRGERWGIFGPNGSGKTTLLSLICSDHPQTYSLPIKLFGYSRIPERGQKGISIFEIQARIGHSSPEIHSHIPRSMTLRQVLENAWSDTFRGVPKLDESAHQKIDACLRWFERDLRQGNYIAKIDTVPDNEKPTWADDVAFGFLPFSAQRVALFLRAVIKQPDIVILDEAFSGMDDGVRDRCLLFLAHGETKIITGGDGAGHITVVESEIGKRNLVKVGGLKDSQVLLCISHVREEIPGSIREWICLPEANTGEPARFGRLEGPIEGNYRRWNEIWGM